MYGNAHALGVCVLNSRNKVSETLDNDSYSCFEHFSFIHSTKSHSC